MNQTHPILTFSWTSNLNLDFRVYRLHERLVNLRSEYNLRLKSGVTTAQIPMTQIHPVQVMQQAPVLQQAPMRLRPELDEVTMRYIQDLLGWVEENQRRVDNGEWGTDLPSVESQLGSHRGLHQSVEEFRSKIERARADEVTTFPSEVFFKYILKPFFKKLFFPSTYTESDLTCQQSCLPRLPWKAGAAVQQTAGESQKKDTKKLLIGWNTGLRKDVSVAFSHQNTSKVRLQYLDQLHAFVNAATKELMWLNDKEEEEVNYDWSERNSNMTSKKDNYSVEEFRSSALVIVTAAGSWLFVFWAAGSDERAGAQGEEGERRPGHGRQAAERRTPSQNDYWGRTQQHTCSLETLHQPVEIPFIL